MATRPTLSIQPRWWIDGWELSEGFTRDIETVEGWSSIPAVRGEPAVVANRAGVIWSPGKRGPGEVTLNMWLAGGSLREAQNIWDDLVRAASPAHRLVTLKRLASDGTERVCEATLSGGLQPTNVGRRGYRAALRFSIPDGVWRSSVESVHSSDEGQDYVRMPILATSTAPIENLRVSIKGPISEPVLHDTTPGGSKDWVRYLGTIPAGGTLTLDSWTWKVKSTGFTADPSLVIPKGNRFLSLQPLSPGLGGVHTLQLPGAPKAFGAITVEAFSAFY